MADLRERFPNVPQEYVELVSEGTEIQLQDATGRYFRIWGPSGCIEMDEAYGISQRIPNAISIGDDGGGQVIFYHHGSHGFGVYCVGYGNLDADDAIWIAPTLIDVLSRATGITSLGSSSD